MNIYLASRFDNRFMLREKREQLHLLGHVVTSSWIDREDRPDKKTEEWTKFAEFWSTQDIEDMESADIMIVDTTGDPHSGGVHVELGYMLAKQRNIIHIGPRCNVFYYQPAIQHYDSWDEYFQVEKGEK